MKIPLMNIIYFSVMSYFIWHAFKRVMQHLDSKENKKFIEKFVDIHAILTFHMEAAYETIHKDNILVFSLDGVKPNEKDIDKLNHEFVKLVMTLSGPNMLGLFEELYGDEDTLFFVMMDYFNRKFEDDEIRSSAIDNIQEGEEL
jgi:hypothetical protein